MSNEYQDLGTVHLVILSGGIIDLYVTDSNETGEVTKARVNAEERAKRIGGIVASLPITARYDGK